MDRREILRYTAYITGAAVSAPLAATILTGCKTEGNLSSEVLQFFDKEQMTLVGQLIDIIIPKTDSPSATDVGVHHTIDHMVGSVYNDADRAAYDTSIKTLLAHLSSSDDLNRAVSSLEDASSSIDNDVRTSYQQLKAQTIAYYLSSEEIGTKYLNYLPVPGEWQSCLTVEEAGGKKWAI